MRCAPNPAALVGRWMTPPLLRFLERKIYLATVATLISAMLQATTLARMVAVDIIGLPVSLFGCFAGGAEHKLRVLPRFPGPLTGGASAMRAFDGRRRSAEDARRRPLAPPLTVGPHIVSKAGVADHGGSRVHERWTQLRFSVVGQLLAAAPAKGELSAVSKQLAACEWRHPSWRQGDRISE